MKTTINPQWHFIAILLAVLVVAFRARTILDHSAWSAGKETVLGHIDDIAASRKIRVIYYSFELDGKKYSGEAYGRHKFLSGMPATVTYAKGRPNVSTLFPDEIEAAFWGSVSVVGGGLAPMLIMWFLELYRKFRK